MDAPRIDKRTYQDIVTEVERLAKDNSGWRPAGPSGNEQPDAGGALIHIFGRFAELIIERLNRTPDRNLLAFLNLIGTDILPPRPARAPLTFQLAANSPVDAAVPAGTQTAAPPLEGEEDDVIFETERNLVVSRSQIQAVFVRDTEADFYSDRSQQALGKTDKPFTVFQGDQAVPHQLYTACDAVLMQPGEKSVTLVIKSADTWQWKAWPIEWSYWNGKVWQQKTPTKTEMEIKSGAWRVTIDKLPPLGPHTINGRKAGWLRGQLKLPLLPAKSNLVPESVASGSANPRNLALPFYPFGKTASVTLFYLSADQAFRAAGAVAQLSVTLAQAGVAQNSSKFRMTWLYCKSKDTWVELGKSGPGTPSSGSADFGFDDSSRALTQNGTVSFRVPVDWELTLYRNRSGRWLRVQIEEKEQYSTLPQIGSLTVSYAWQLPSISAITVEPGSSTAALKPEMAFFNSAPIDLNNEFYPLGEEPSQADRFYIACDQALAKPGQTVKLDVKLTTAGMTTGNAKIAWEVWNGRNWHEVKKGDTWPTPETLTQEGEITLPLRQAMSATTVNGEKKHWLRARLVEGDYGKGASAKISDTKATTKVTRTEGTTTSTYDYEYDVYEEVAATYKPPLVASIEFSRQTGTHQLPVSACLAYNDFAYVDLVGKMPGAKPFSVTEDTRPALYVGLDRAFDPRPVTLYLGVEPPRPEEVAAAKLAEVDPDMLGQLTWEYASPRGWLALGARDHTQTLARRDLVDFIGPKDFKVSALFGWQLYWLRARWRSGEYPLMPRLRRVLLNTTWASQVTSIGQENLGSSNGNANQVFKSAQTPVQSGHQLQVREPQMLNKDEKQALEKLEGSDAVELTLDAAGETDEIWVRWHAIADFYDSRPRDRHYTLDPLSGEIRFGDGEYGLVPPLGQNNIRLTYRSGGGFRGNRAVASIVELKSSVPYIDSVVNHEPASGGAAQESPERAKLRGPRRLRHRDRSVTVQDLEDLAREAHPDVARTRAVVPSFRPGNLWLDPSPGGPAADIKEHEQAGAGRVGVIVVPQSDATRPAPSLSMLRHIKAYLLDRYPATADLWVAGPEWIEVSVRATVVPTSVEIADTVGARVQAALARFLNPLTGGEDKQGWPFGGAPKRSDLYAVVEAVTDVNYVRALQLTIDPRTGDDKLKIKLRTWLERPVGSPGQRAAADVQLWLDRALVYAGQHEIQLILETR